MSGIRVVHELGKTLSVSAGDTELFQYVYVPDTVQRESPRPYLHPIRTRAGHLVSGFRPHDHVWHTGLSLALPVVGEENFWGGNSYVPGRSYVQLPNNGSQRHTGELEVTVDPQLTFSHTLEWITQAGEHWFTEKRRISVRLISDSAWALCFDIRLHNVSGNDIALGSPTTRGRENAGYGGLFWRGPRSFTDGILTAPGRQGKGSELRGERHEWMGYLGQHDEVDATSLVLMVDDERNPEHPPQWFARSEEFAALNPAHFFSTEVTIAAGESAQYRFGFAVADAAEDDSESLAAATRRLLSETR